MLPGPLALANRDVLSACIARFLSGPPWEKTGENDPQPRGRVNYSPWRRVIL